MRPLQSKSNSQDVNGGEGGLLFAEVEECKKPINK